MAGPAATGITSVVSALSGALGSLTPTQTLLLGGHLTSGNAAKAMSYISAMIGNPAGSGAFLALLGSVPNLNPQVMTWASQAVASLPNLALFNSNMTQAQVALQSELASENALQQAFGI